MRSRLSRLAGLALVFAALASCKAGGPASPYEKLDEHASALRDQFNADIGHVRVILLVAPT